MITTSNLLLDPGKEKQADPVHKDEPKSHDLNERIHNSSVSITLHTIK